MIFYLIISLHDYNIANQCNKLQHELKRQSVTRMPHRQPRRRVGQAAL